MKQYTVAEIANLLNIDKETIRRWIRSNKLKASQASRKIGNVVEEEDLYEFLQTMPKYRKIICLTEHTFDNDAYTKKLNEILKSLIKERDMLDERINKIQALLEEL